MRALNLKFRLLLKFIFDAKYKIDTSYEYKKKYNTPGPKEEDINTMHRYRDAIIYYYKKDKLFNKKTSKLENSKNLNKDEVIDKNEDYFKYLKMKILKKIQIY